MYKFFLCSRYLSTRSIGLVSIVSVMLGVMTMIVVNSVMSGFREKMRERLHGVLADIVVEGDMNGFHEPERVVERIEQTCGDKIAAMTPTVHVWGILTQDLGGRSISRAVEIIGIDPKGRAAVGDFSEHLTNPDNARDPSFELRADALTWRETNQAAIERDSDWQGAIIGYQIGTVRIPGSKEDEKILEPGQEFILTTISAGKPPRPVDDRYIVVDYFKSDMSEYDSNYVFVPIERLQSIRMMGDAVTSIQIKLKNERDSAFVVETLRENLHPFFFHVATWEDKQGALLKAVQVEAWILNMILFFIIAVAGFGILAIFYLLVMEKTRDIGILKALGAGDSGIMGIFMGYGLILGMIGCFLGGLGGVLFTLYINPIEQWLTRQTGFEIFPRDIYYFKEIPFLLNPWTILWIVFGALAIAVSASVLPARKAARLKPVEALRYE